LKESVDYRGAKNVMVLVVDPVLESLLCHLSSTSLGILLSILVHHRKSILNSWFQFVFQDVNGILWKTDTGKQHFSDQVEDTCCLKIFPVFVFVVQLLLFVFEQTAFVPADVVV
jgi:hypothetical protein